MKKFVDKVNKIDIVINYISYSGTILGAILIVAMVVMITINVIIRKTIGWAFLFVEEYSGYALVLMVYFGVAYALRLDKHIHMELLIRKFNYRLRNYINLIIIIVCLGLLLYMLIKSIQFFLFSLTFNIKSEWYSASIMWPFHLLIPIGLTIFFLEMAVNFIKLFIKILGEGKEKVKQFASHSKEEL
jgi:TRAP-type C4-dicarboxylate transport system permease small subunit